MSPMPATHHVLHDPVLRAITRLLRSPTLPRSWIYGLLGLLSLSAPTSVGAQAIPELDQAMQSFWSAESPAQQQRAIRDILALQPGVEDLLARLESGRPYSSEVQTGRLLRSRGSRFHYVLLVPESYDPSRRYPLRVLLHGGVNRPAPRRPDGSWWQGIDRAAHEERLVVIPAAWDTAMWWHENQGESVPAIVRRVRRSYNVDEDRVSMIGISDGGTGAFYHALTRPTPWASFVSLIGHSRVLASPTLKLSTQFYVSNLVNRPIYAVNGGRDRLYPVSSVQPVLQHFADAGADIVFRPKPEAGHDLSWWPEEAESIDRFLDEHPRDPLPDRLSWTTEDPQSRGRCGWLQILELGKVAGDSELEDPNEIVSRPSLALGVLPADADDGPGVKLRSVQRRSPAAQAGLKSGDRIVQVGSTAVSSAQALAFEVGRQADFGKALDFAVTRRGKERTVRVQLPQLPDPLPRVQLFPRDRSSGRVDLRREGQSVLAQTRGVRRFRLLISPRHFDLEQSLRVVVNGREVFRGLVQADPAVLLRWAAVDQDRSQLYVAELDIEVQPASG